MKLSCFHAPAKFERDGEEKLANRPMAMDTVQPFQSRFGMCRICFVVRL